MVQSHTTCFRRSVLAVSAATDMEAPLQIETSQIWCPFFLEMLNIKVTSLVGYVEICHGHVLLRRAAVYVKRADGNQ